MALTWPTKIGKEILWCHAAPGPTEQKQAPAKVTIRPRVVEERWERIDHDRPRWVGIPTEKDME